MPEISIITAVKNGAKYLPETIDSIINQSFEDWEYILIDDASTDNTREIILSYVEKDKRIKLIQRKKSGGPFVAANEAIKSASGKYIARTDADDISFPQRLEKQLIFLKKHTGIRAVASYCQWYDEGPSNGLLKAPLSSNVLKWLLCLRCPLVHSSAMFEKSVFDEIGGYKEEPLSQDYRLWCDLSRKDYLAVLPEILVYFRKHENRVTLTQKSEQMRLSKKILQDHIHVLSNTEWNSDATEALYSFGYSQYYTVSGAINSHKIWRDLWKKDLRLTLKEKKELRQISKFRVRKFLKSNLKNQPFEVLKYLIAFI